MVHPDYFQNDQMTDIEIEIISSNVIVWMTRPKGKRTKLLEWYDHAFKILFGGVSLAINNCKYYLSELSINPIIGEQGMKEAIRDDPNMQKFSEKIFRGQYRNREEEAHSRNLSFG